MIEEEFKVKTEDGKYIYGVLTSKKKSKKVIIWIHGLTGSIDEYHIKASSYAFSKKGYDVIRFSLYSNGNEARILEDCTLQDHANDINDIINKKCKEYKKIFLVSHSYGGPAVLIANNDRMSAVSLWDPGFDLTSSFDLKRLDIQKISDNKYTKHIGKKVIIGKRMVDESEKYTKEECIKLAKNVKFPIQVINAGTTRHAKNKQNYSSFGNILNTRYIVKDSDHNFTKKEWLDEAIKQTLKWFKKF